jgi:3-methylfumaryl-CoA hydratase
MKIADLTVGDSLPDRKHTPTNVSLFLYNAAVWNAHRIHYDELYTKNEEEHPEIVVDGPLQGDWLAQCVDNWLEEDGVVEQFHYSNRRATYLGETLVSGGHVLEINEADKTAVIELWIKNAQGEITSPGGATVVLNN